MANIRQSHRGTKKSNSKSGAKTLAVLTGGGDCPGLNAAIRAVTRRAGLEGIPVWGIHEGFQGLYEGNMRLLGSLDIAGIISRGGTILGTSRFNPLTHRDGIKKIKGVFRKKKISCLFAIGGEGTQRFAYELHQNGLPCIGVPKTIDNDVYGTDFTFGFDTAVSIATEAIDRLHTTAESHNRVMLIEVMGRHTGWIATMAGIAGGADAILIPEEVFPMSRLVKIIETRRRTGKKFSIIVVSEDAKILLDLYKGKKELLKTPMGEDEYGHLKLGGITTLLEKELRRYLNMEIRSTILGYIQRGGSPTAYDRILATRLGVAAVELAMKGKSGMMVGLQGNEIKAVPLSHVVKRLKTVDKKIYQVGEVFFD
jgi:6-phosphofructokinase 1